MDLYNYKRAYSLVVGAPPTYKNLYPSPLSEEIAGITVDGFQPPNFRSETLNALEFSTKDNNSALRIVAQVEGNEKSQGTDATTTTIKIYNLSKESVSIVCRKNNFVLLKAGYSYQEDEDALPLIFSGQVESYLTEEQGEDIVTTLTCKSGYTTSDAVRISIGIKPIPRSLATQQISYQDVFNKLLWAWRSNGINYDETTVELEAGIPLTPKYPKEVLLPNGWSYDGYLKDAMDDVCESLGYKWYVQNDLIYIHPLLYSKQKQVIPLKDNLVKSILPQTQGSRGLSTTDGVSGYLIKTNLDSRLKLSDYVTVEDYKGMESTYRIVQVSHTMDYRGQSWDTDVLCEVIQ